MKIVIPVIGSRGDVQPFIALAQGLSAAGYEVRIASHPGMRPLIEAHGVPFVGLGPDIDMSLEAARIRDRTGNPMIGLIRVMGYAFEVMEKCHQDLLEICELTEFVIVHAQSAFGKNEADLLELPYAGVTFMPWAIPYRDPARPLLKRIGYRAFDRIISLITTRPLNRLRRKFNLSPVGDEGFFSSHLNLIPLSPAIFPHNPLWNPTFRTTGYWFVQDPPHWEPPENLRVFLAAGEPPIVVSLGAMSFGERSAMEAVEIFMAALEIAGVRALIQGWSKFFTDRRLPETILPVGSVPHAWLLPQTAGIIHHGGFGTTGAGFRGVFPN